MKKIALLLPVVFLYFNLSHAQSDSIRMFMFGHSLMEYSSSLTINDEGKIAHWIHQLAATENKYFASTGQWGFLPQHAMLPPIAAWGYNSVPAVWDSDTEPFSEADFNRILITAGNFMEWQPPHFEYPTNPGVSPVSATETIIDWVIMQEDSVKFYLYENWPDFARFLPNGFPPSGNEFSEYNDYCIGTFNDWWLEYQDSLLSSRPDVNIRMIPVGPVISKLFTELPTEPIPITELYEDDAPHGRASIYFLAGLITYMGVYETPAPLNFQVPASVHEEIRNNYADVVNFIWNELTEFNDSDGISRVFCKNQTSSIVDKEEATFAEIAPNPSTGIFEIFGIPQQSEIEVYNILGSIQQNVFVNPGTPISADISSLPNGTYFVKIFNPITKQTAVNKIYKLR